MIDVHSEHRLLGIVAVSLSLASFGSAATTDFMGEVRPILEASCVECHAFGRQQGRFSLESRASMLSHESAVSPGDVSASRLLALVRGDEEDLVMPYRGDRLTEHQVETLARWIEEGAVWPEDFTFTDPEEATSVRLRRPAAPAPGEELTHPIDRILDAYATSAGIELEPIVDDSTFLRRTSLDLIGLLPSASSRRAFAEDPDRQVLVRTLLEDGPNYAAHWMSFWNDLLRNDYSGTGYIDGGRKQITAWLYASLLDNKPYDEFVTELVDPIPEAEGFAAGIAWRGEASASQIPELQYSRSVSQVFLGTNLKCASCHDSFINQWKLADTYGLAAVIADRPLELHRCDKPTGEMARAAFLFPELGDVDPDAPRAQRLRQFAQLLVSPENGRFSRTIVNRLWQRLMGRGLVEPVDDLDQPPWSAELLDYLAADLTDHDYDLKHSLERIATSGAYQRRFVALDPQAAPESFVFRGPAPKRLTAEQFVDALWSLSDSRPEAPAQSLEEMATGEVPVRAATVASDSLMRVLGRPNREQVVSTRPSELVTLQALELTNGEMVADQIRSAATRWLVLALPERELVDQLFRELLTRSPTDAERTVALEVLAAGEATDSLEDLLWILLMHPEFQLVG